MIEARKVCKSFQQGPNTIEVIKNLDMEVRDGELVAVVGQSGSGKSTLLSLLALLDSPDKGDILFDGRNLTQLSQSERTAVRGKSIGIVFQQFHLVPHLSAIENVALPLIIQGQKDAMEKAELLLEKVGLKKRASHRPSQLSGGESQRVAMARALIHNPRLLLADEPSGNLDVRTAGSVMDLFFEVASGLKTSTILVTHDMELAKRCPKILTLKDGVLCS